MNKWAFFRFALSILAIILGLALGVKVGINHNQNQYKSKILSQIERNHEQDTIIEHHFSSNKPDIIKRLQKHQSN